MRRWFQRFSFPRLTRDSVLFGLGLYLAYQKVTSGGPERVSDIILILMLLGLPVSFLKDDDRSGPKQ